MSVSSIAQSRVVGSRSPLLRSFRPVVTTGVGLATVASVLIVLAVTVGLGGWRYYSAPLDARATLDLHSLLRPSGLIGNSLGIAGLTLMVVMHLYTLRKKVPALSWMGPLSFWLEFHIFCGVLGPVLITLHTSFKFNGIISVAYWSMVVVMLSGFVGRYLYVRIPRSIRGRELGQREVADRLSELGAQLDASGLGTELRARIDRFEGSEIPGAEADATWGGLLLGEVRMHWRLAALGREVRRQTRDRALADHAVALIAEHATLLRRIAYLKKTRTLFDLWRVYHKPLAVLAGVIVALHVAIVWYFGYAFAMGR